MSTSVTVHEPHLLTDAMDRLKSDNGQTEDYVLVGHYEANPAVIELQAAGSGVDNLASQLDETQVQYALIRMKEQFDISTTSKFVHIHW